MNLTISDPTVVHQMPTKNLKRGSVYGTPGKDLGVEKAFRFGYSPPKMCHILRCPCPTIHSPCFVFKTKKQADRPRSRTPPAGNRHHMLPRGSKMAGLPSIHQAPVRSMLSAGSTFLARASPDHASPTPCRIDVDDEKKRGA